MINLLPPDIKEARRFGRRNILMLRYSIVIACIAVLSITVFLFNMKYVRDDEARLKVEMKELTTKATELEAGQKSVDKIATQLNTIDKLYSGEVKFSQLVPEIGALLPKGVVLNSLSLTGGTNSPLQLDVDLESQDLAAVLQQNLVNSKLFSAADISNIISKGASSSKSGLKTYAFGATLVATFESSTKKVTK